ncbi:zinc-dependent peptidase [Aurantiacibacter gangjinensis]|uniref:Uncharacterized protein n=1 Tax=Aurantiacibacter gangjinensis TaxID=502682 RepID=A0A0G9MPI5_9SPHN|nr:M90 family metallopeptidase [Aurantiacibacter gangjinensis]APE28304.1 hypothetical protein BMF35_a1475 [Aurantiacibacter gangjinensis]KLE32544.1 hypothetical protein AAW01_00260 [Aurantiacibacter gangjinensis]
MLDYWPILLIAIVVLAFAARSYAKRAKRKRLLATPLTREQRQVLARLVPITRRLPDELRPKLEGKINLFLDQVTFHGNNGIEMRDEMRLSIAAQACLLVVNSPVWFDTLRTILVYPSAFSTGRGDHDGFLVHERDSGTAGESWDRGPVILSWDHALHGGLDPADGHNVVIHEFAHQLDALTGSTNGIPILRKGQRYEKWEKAMLDAYNSHLESVERGQSTLIDPYGATNHQEFFAEATVTFFEKPRDMRREEPRLYEQLAQLYALDPAGWG